MLFKDPLFRLLDGHLDRVADAARLSLVERVEDYIRGSLPSGACSVERCANKLGMPLRTLQAGLGDERVCFSDILEAQRVELAKRYLQQPERSLDEVAALLGYADQSSFGRAFRRWTGSTPQHYRQSSADRASRLAQA